VRDHRQAVKLGDITMQAESIKQEAYRLLDNLPEQATWDDLMDRIYVRQAIEAGIRDSDAGETLDVHEIRKRFGLKE
jgi:predicted transcriptional regulator